MTSEAGSKQQWTERLQMQQASGVSAAAYCREHGLKEWRFSYWKKKILNEKSDQVSKRPTKPRFAKVQVSGTFVSAKVTLRFPGNVVLETAGGYPDPAWLRNILSALAAEGV